MNQEDFCKKLETLLARLKSTKKKKYELNEDTTQSIRNLMRDLLDLYIALKREPKLFQNEKYLNYLNESSPLLIGLNFDIYIFKMEIQDTVESTFYDDEWVGVCRRRSALEALKEMYADTPFGEHLPEFEDEDLDYMIEGKGSYEGYLPHEKIPDGIPHSHWWWWAPQQPDSSGDK